MLFGRDDVKHIPAHTVVRFSLRKSRARQRLVQRYARRDRLRERFYPVFGLAVSALNELCKRISPLGEQAQALAFAVFFGQKRLYLLLLPDFHRRASLKAKSRLKARPYTP